MAEEEKDDWLEDIGDDEKSPNQLNQADLDSLLAGDGLEQTNIDDLLAGDGEEEDISKADSSDDELIAGDLDQADIDNLFASDEEPASSATAPTAQEQDDSGDEEIDQSDIDALLAGDVASNEEIPDISPDQEEIDRLFSEIDEDGPDPFQAEEIDFEDVLDESDADDSFLNTGNEFAEEEFNFDDDLNIPDIPEDEEPTVLETGDKTPLDHKAALPKPPPQEDAAQAAAFSEPEVDVRKFKMPEIPIPPMLQNRKNQSLVAGFIVLLLIITVLFFSGADKSPQIAEQTAVQPQESGNPPPAQQPPATPNTAPIVTDTEILMDDTQGPLTIQLAATDPEGDELQYEILSAPEHGKLEGQAPNLIYTPNKDFSDMDLFHFRVGDGRDFSAPALVKILRKPAETLALALPPKAETKKIETIQPRRLIISAQDLTYDVVGTQDFFIDWQSVWDKANYLPYTNQVAVEILSEQLRGNLQKQSAVLHKYRAKKYAGGQEIIRYRFKLGKLHSKTRTITLTIDPGDPDPEIVLQPVAEFYKPGEQVLLDTASSMDDDRESLTFTWTQIAGVPVQLEFLNRERSQVTFIAPSSFSTVKNPGPLMRVTVTDKSGQEDVRDIKIVTRSRYNSALWGDIADSQF